jgi:hypothetical protein
VLSFQVADVVSIIGMFFSEEAIIAIVHVLKANLKRRLRIMATTHFYISDRMLHSGSKQLKTATKLAMILQTFYSFFWQNQKHIRFR